MPQQGRLHTLQRWKLTLYDIGIYHGEFVGRRVGIAAVDIVVWGAVQHNGSVVGKDHRARLLAILQACGVTHSCFKACVINTWADEHGMQDTCMEARRDMHAG